MRKSIVTAPGIGGTYSATTAHATEAGNFLFVTGQVANKPGTDPARAPEEVGEMGTLEEQTTRVLENIKSILEAAGTSFDKVVKRNVYLTHPEDYITVYKLMERYFTSRVASTGVVTGLIPASARVEIEVIAVIPDP